jgi:hypothetical protein
MRGGKSDVAAERVDELLLCRYLLGSLSEEEQVRVENRAFADREYLNRIEAVEADLIDTYVRGELAGDKRRAFERRFLTSPQRRRKVAFARALAQIGDEAKPARVDVPERPGWRALLAAITGWNVAVQFAAAMAVLGCAAAIWWVVGQHTDAVPVEQPKLEVRKEKPRNQPPPPAEKKAAPAPSVAVLVLSAGLTRSATETKELVLNSGVQTARIEVQLQERDKYPHFRAELRTRTGKAILTRSNLVRRRAGAGYAVSFDVPASALRTDEYELAMQGIGEGTALEELGYYYFAVRKAGK